MQALGDVYYKAILKLHNRTAEGETIEKWKLGELYRLMNGFFTHIIKQEKLQFSTQFARIAFASHKFDLPKKTRWYIQEFRKQSEKILFSDAKIKEEFYWLGLRGLSEAVQGVTKMDIPLTLLKFLPKENFYQKSTIQVDFFKKKARIIVWEVLEDEKLLICQDEDITEGTVKVKYDVTAVNENFNSTIIAIRRLWKTRQAVLNLLDIEVDHNGVYYPKRIVLEPDYLLDVSAVAGCFMPNGSNAMLYLLRKFLPMQSSIPLMVGNIANFFLDELMSNQDAQFNEIFPMVFRMNPLGFTMLEDSEIRKVMQDSKRHFVSLKQMVKQGFKDNDIDPKQCYLEPSFYSEQFGLQGRLDVFYKDKENEQYSAIVELKSGKPFMPNKGGISQSHYIQALLYDLIIQSVFKQKAPRSYILYSKLVTEHLKFVYVLRAKQDEALKVRNQLVAIEQALVNLNDKKDKSNTILDMLNPNRFPNLRGFHKKNLELFSGVLSKTSPLERQYFLMFTSFVAREHQLAKTGIQGIDTLNGLASLWLNHFDEKDESFEIIGYLKVVGNKQESNNQLITFQKDPEKTNNLANFRPGDIAILYPSNQPKKEVKPVLKNQIFKCTIIKITETEVTIRLRSKQFNDSIFEKKEQLWVLEHDMMDHSFNAMYRGLFAFLQFPLYKKQLLLTERIPQKPATKSHLKNIKQLSDYTQMTKEQQRILNKALLAPDYFLLWGPPGTGKTSVMLRNMVEYLFYHTDENILLLAYTNRAVDEICEAIESIGTATKENYIRIGSKYSTHPKFHHVLFNTKIEKVKRRKVLKGIIEEHRIFVATVSSMSSKQELLDLKQFNRVIIDEASQILEPMLVGLLPHFKRFILVGDHKQLPAVVTQDKERSMVKEAALNDLGLHNLRDSLFERLFLRCKSQKWTWAYDMLSHQGRMHNDIMAFPNQYFYGENLKILPEYCKVDQESILEYQLSENPTDLEKQLITNRIGYIPTKVDFDNKASKTNIYEAEWIAKLVDTYCTIYKTNNRPIDFNKTIGIITPYRAQIAQIKGELRRYNKGYENFSVDTVERYQGSAREVILISLCLNRESQLDSLVSLSTDGQVDRKLNVALTRARKHLIVVGNEVLMQMSPIYWKLIKAFGRINL